MENYAWTALATLVALLLFLVMGMRVGGARYKFKVEAPATVGHPDFERHFRVHMNTLEWLPIFLPSMWLFAAYWGDQIAAGIGAVWILGRFIYMLGYVNNAKSRGIGFLVQMLSAVVLLVGALIGAVQMLIAMYAG